MKRYVFDIEADGLLTATTKRSKSGIQALPTVRTIWTLCISSLDDPQSVDHYTGRDIELGVALLRSADLVIGHNVTMYDIPVLERFYGPINTKVHDTLIMSQLVYGPPQNIKFPIKTEEGKPSHSLAAWGNYLKCPKIDFHDWSKLTPEMIEYCKQDVVVNIKIYNHLLPLILKKNLQESARLEHEVHRICAEMTVNGWGFDLKKAEELQYTVMNRMAAINDTMQREFPPITHERISEKTGKVLKPYIEVFNPSSNKMVASRLKEKYGWNAPLTPKGNPNIDSVVLAGLEFPEAKMLVEYSELEKKMGYLEDWIERASSSPDGRIRPSFNPLRAATGRMSSSQPNIQQIDKSPEIRSLFIPHKGHLLVGADAAGLEGRLAAHETNRFDGGVFMDMLLNGDMHTANRELFAPYAKGEFTRNTAKTLFYGALLYGAGDRRTGEILGWSDPEEAARVGGEAKRAYLDKWKQISQINESAQFEMRKNGHVKLVDGRQVTPPYVYSEWRKKWEIPVHKSLNYRIQGNGAVLMKTALVLAKRELSNQLKPTDYALLAIVHDEIQCSATPESAERVRTILMGSISNAGTQLGFTCPMLGDSKKPGKSWAETH